MCYFTILVPWDFLDELFEAHFVSPNTRLHVNTRLLFLSFHFSVPFTGYWVIQVFFLDWITLYHLISLYIVWDAVSVSQIGLLLKRNTLYLRWSLLYSLRAQLSFVIFNTLCLAGVFIYCLPKGHHSLGVPFVSENQWLSNS